MLPPFYLKTLSANFCFLLCLYLAINNNLEQQAQAIFENTFCNPSNAETKQISLSELMEYAGGSQPLALEFIFNEKDGYIRFVQIRDYDTDSHITYISVSTKNKLCDEHDIMIARYGASLGLYVLELTERIM